MAKEEKNKETEISSEPSVEDEQVVEEKAKAEEQGEAVEKAKSEEKDADAEVVEDKPAEKAKAEEKGEAVEKAKAEEKDADAEVVKDKPADGESTEDEKPEAAKGEKAGDRDAKGKSAAPSKPESDAAEKVVTAKTLRKMARSRQTRPTEPQKNPQERDRLRLERRAKKAEARRRSRQRVADRAGSADPGSEKKGPTAEVVEQSEPIRKQRQGTVVSSSQDKTITVQIETRRPHRTYKKVIRRTSKLYVHDEQNEAKEGDVVRVLECRPLSRAKRWRLLEIVKRSR